MPILSIGLDNQIEALEPKYSLVANFFINILVQKETYFFELLLNKQSGGFEVYNCDFYDSGDSEQWEGNIKDVRFSAYHWWIDLEEDIYIGEEEFSELLILIACAYCRMFPDDEQKIQQLFRKRHSNL